MPIDIKAAQKWTQEWGYENGLNNEICAFPQDPHYSKGYREGTIARLTRSRSPIEKNLDSRPAQ